MFDTLKLVALILAIIGALNWGLVGLLDINLVTLLFGGVPILAKLIYSLVGLSGLILIPHLKDHLKTKF
jgi:uncharacterized membrane protein YuzA (DUF378 family)